MVSKAGFCLALNDLNSLRFFLKLKVSLLNPLFPWNRVLLVVVDVAVVVVVIVVVEVVFVVVEVVVVSVVVVVVISVVVVVVVSVVVVVVVVVVALDIWVLKEVGILDSKPVFFLIEPKALAPDLKSNLLPLLKPAPKSEARPMASVVRAAVVVVVVVVVVASVVVGILDSKPVFFLIEPKALAPDCKSNLLPLLKPDPKFEARPIESVVEAAIVVVVVVVVAADCAAKLNLDPPTHQGI